MQTGLSVIVKDSKDEIILDVSESSFVNKKEDDQKEISKIKNFLGKVIEHLDFRDKVLEAQDLARTFHIEPTSNINTVLHDWEQALYEKGLQPYNEIKDQFTKVLIKRCLAELSEVDLSKEEEKYWKAKVDSHF